MTVRCGDVGRREMDGREAGWGGTRREERVESDKGGAETRGRPAALQQGQRGKKEGGRVRGAAGDG